MDLSILIPARNEQFLVRTIEDILQHIEADTEIIVGLDGQWSEPGIPQNPRVNVFYVPEAIGQRAMQNRLAKMSKAKYVMKVDAHCSFDQGFDRKMLEAFKETGDNVVMVPLMRNLHAFDWVCQKCGYRMYQGPTPEKCPKCGGEMKKEMVWKAKSSPQSVSYCFDSEPHFQYFKEYAKRPEYQKSLKDTGLTETMSLQGSCFMTTREKYWKLNICDEKAFGSWGSQGIETSLKFWLSGGKVLVNHNTWYAHMFRTQGGDFSFPYPLSGRQVQNAKHYAKDLFFGNRWSLQKYPLSYVLEKFYPINGWSDEDIEKQRLREMKNSRSGIYCIKCKKNNKIYIGSAKKISQRFKEHLRMLRGNYHDNDHLQKAWNKYGEDAFQFKILRFCNVEELLKYEQKYIDDYKSKIGWDNMFNINPVAASKLGSKHTPESIAKMSKQQSGSGNGFYGKHHTEESKRKMRESSMGQIAWNKGKHWSDEVKRKISLAKKGHIPWNKGLTKETDSRIKESPIKGIHIWENKKHPQGMLGKKHSEETKEKIRENSKRVAKERLRNSNGQFIRFKKGIIFYTDNQLNLKIAHKVQKQLKKIGIPIVSASLKPMTFGDKNIVIKGKRSYLTMFKQQLAALEASDADIIYFCEHDILYHPSHFDFIPVRDDTFYYNINVWKWKYPEPYFLKVDVCRQVSGIVVARETAIKHYRERVAYVEKHGYNRNMGFEPGTHTRMKWQNQFRAENFESKYPIIDIRHNNNLTPNRWSKDQFRNKKNTEGWTISKEVPGWEL